jgi:glycosyltransferase involved in cell wall biosynthesis
MDQPHDTSSNPRPAPALADVILVIPAYKEELVIGSVVLKARRIVEKIIVVDDGSPDQTAEVAACAGAEVIRLDHNTGKAYALLLGLKRAHELGCRAAVSIDGDGQHKTRDIADVVRPVLEGKADLVIGSRFLGKASDVPVYRRMGQKTLDIFTRIGSGHRSTDTQSGFRAFSPKALDNLDFPSSGYNIESDMIAHFAERGLVMVEVPITVRYEVPNKHKMNPLAHGLSVLARIINLISYRRPLIAFGVPGFILFIAGFGISALSLSEYFLTTSYSLTISLIGATLLGIGLLLMVAGLILNALVAIMNKRKNS